MIRSVGLLTALVVIAVVLARLTGVNGARQSGGEIVLSVQNSGLSDETLVLGLSADIELSTTMQAGLDNGVPLTFILELELLQMQRFWLDRTLARFAKRYKLTYYELTRHYRVQALDSGASQNYRSLSSALDGLGDFQGLVFGLNESDVLQLSNEASLTGAVRLRLDTAALPLPLQPLPLQPLVRSSWRLTSEEYRWPVI
ncbi:MAG: DUF4390 domain-containing protein [Granulosicoccus sp.]